MTPLSMRLLKVDKLSCESICSENTVYMVCNTETTAFFNQNVVWLFFGKYFTITLRSFKKNVTIVSRKGTKYKSMQLE